MAEERETMSGREIAVLRGLRFKEQKEKLRMISRGYWPE